MLTAQHNILETDHDKSTTQLFSASQVAVSVLLGIALCTGLILAFPILLVVCWFKLKPNATTLLVILALTGILVLAALLFLGQQLWKNTIQLMRRTAAPEVNAFLANTTAAISLLWL